MSALVHRDNSVSWFLQAAGSRAGRIGFAALLGAAVALHPVDTAAAPGQSLTINSVDASAFPTVTARVTITKGGRPTSMYNSGDFEVTENGQRGKQVEVTTTFDPTEPLAVVVLVDMSGDMDEQSLAAIHSAAKRFFAGLGEPGPASLLAFSSQTRVIHDFTTDRPALERSLATLQAGGNTALYDGLFAAVDYGAKSNTRRTLVAVITDGNDTSSKAALQDGINLARQNGLPVYAVGVGPAVNRQVLTQMAEATGGAAYFNPSPVELDQAYRALSESLRAQYLIKYRSPAPRGSMSYHLSVTAGGHLFFNQVKAETDFAVNLQRPTISGISLSDGAVVREPTSLSVTTEGPRPVAVVQFDINGHRVAEPVTPPYAMDLDPYALAVGRHQVSVTVVDQAGNSAATRMAITVPPGISRPEVAPPSVPASGTSISFPAISFPTVPELDIDAFSTMLVTRATGLLDAVTMTRDLLMERIKLIGYAGLLVAASAAGVVELGKMVGMMRRRLQWVSCPECQTRYRAYQDSCPHCWLERGLAQYADRSLGTLLVENQLLSPGDLAACLARSAENRKPLEVNLVEMGLLTGDQLRQAMFYYNRSAEMAKRRKELLTTRAEKRLWDTRAFAPHLVLALTAFSVGGISLPNILG